MPSDIQNRLVLAMINEAANILFDGIAATAADVDLVIGSRIWLSALAWWALALCRPDWC